MKPRWHLWLAAAVTFTTVSMALALSPHDKAVGVEAYQKSKDAIDAKAKAERDESKAAPAPTLIPPSESASQQGNTGKHGENGEKEGTEFWPTFLGYKFKITDSLIALSTLALTVFTGLLWRSTEKLWSSAEKNLKSTERAFVFIDGFNVELTTAADVMVPEAIEIRQIAGRDPTMDIKRFATQPRWKNSGNTPTKGMTIQINWRGPEGKYPPEYDFKGDPKPFFIGPSAVEPSEYIEIPSAPALVSWSMNPIGEEPNILIWGRSDYEDVFGNAHFVDWCYRVRFDRHDGQKMRATFIQWGDHNRSDENA